jgi:hypothetical protein
MKRTTEKRTLPLGKTVAFCAAGVALVLACALGAALWFALMRPSVAMKALPRDIKGEVARLRVSDGGVAIPAQSIATIAGVKINDARVPGVRVREAGGRVMWGGDARISLAVDVAMPKAAPFVGGKRLPVYASVRFALLPGERTSLKLTGVSVGRLRLPMPLVEFALGKALAGASLPGLVKVRGRVFNVELARFGLGGFGPRGWHTHKQAVVLDVGGPDLGNAGKKAVKSTKRIIDKGTRIFN